MEIVLENNISKYLCYNQENKTYIRYYIILLEGGGVQGQGKVQQLMDLVVVREALKKNT